MNRVPSLIDSDESATEDISGNLIFKVLYIIWNFRLVFNLLSIILLPESKRLRSENSEADDVPAMKKRRIIDSDEEDETVITADQRETKPGPMVISDDEDW